MKKIFFASLLITSLCFSQATKNTSGDLIGITSIMDFKQEPYNTWFQKKFDNYSIDKKITKKLKRAFKGVTIKAFMGTWCGDSKREVPKFYKLLELTSFDLKNLEMITVNRAKRTPNNLQKGFEIIRVPTFIFYKKDKEIGRYVEYAKETLEKDILKILTGKEYKHAYHKVN